MFESVYIYIYIYRERERERERERVIEPNIKILLLNPYLKINCWIYRSILGVQLKNLIIISFSRIDLNFGRNEILTFWGIIEDEVFSPT